MQTLQHLTTLQQLQDYQSRHQARCVGFVPTMGNLHAGHLSLIDVVAQYCDNVIVSIFVNPSQFAPHEDFESYPRTLPEDLEKLSHTACNAVFTPSIDEVYPSVINPNYNLAVHPEIEPLSQVLCGVSRPHFFYGVVQVVCRLFEMVQPDYACFGEKDYQQLRIISQVAHKLFPQITVLPAPIKRNENQLALSSRNNYLSTEQLTAAALLPAKINQTISHLHHLSQEGASQSWQAIMQQARKDLENVFTVDYFEVRHSDDLQLIHSLEAAKQARLFAAVSYHNVRLLDNFVI